ncbi:helix-turn-helix transcriptional regulator [Salmonella enterica]|nr:helix-turn-helix transcriptional regulator [Salmonella enterica]EIE7937609.1 helix-turn-helix transcriptional regulator [Salmonella enterica]
MTIGIGQRLREERERLGLSQAALGEIGGVRKQAQLLYENGERKPDAAYLSAVSKFGVDIQYVIVGEHSLSILNDRENNLLTFYRSAPQPVKDAVMAALIVGSLASISDARNISDTGNNENK